MLYGTDLLKLLVVFVFLEKEWIFFFFFMFRRGNLKGKAINHFKCIDFIIIVFVFFFLLLYFLLFLQFGVVNIYAFGIFWGKGSLKDYQLNN